MSMGKACRDRAHHDQWVVVQRHSNHSAFNGNRWTWSPYSEVKCLTCGQVWRTNALYVDALRNATVEEVLRGPGVGGSVGENRGGDPQQG